MISFYALCVIAALSVVGVANVILAHRELLKLERYSPGTLREVGIAKIDWWWECLRGMYRLGSLSAGKDLSAYTRWIFKGVFFLYTWLMIVSIAILAGNLQQLS